MLSVNVRTAAPPKAPKRLRNRSMASCVDCARRKQKCNRKWPCDPCLSRKVGHACQFNTPNAFGAKKTKTVARDPPHHQNSDNGEADDSTEGDESNTTAPRPKSSRNGASIAPSSNGLSMNEKSLDSLGYLANNADNLLGYLRTMNVLDDDDPDLAITTLHTVQITPEVKALLQSMPDRTATDLLIQHFLSDINWLYEMIYPTTFLENYNDWWSHSCQSMDDVEFAALILRLCSYSAQSLPSKNYTADTILGKPISTIREQCDVTATALSNIAVLKENPSSITRVHQLFYRACYLKNEGQMKESWKVLSEAIREAHELGIHLELQKGKGRITSEYDLEMGKRTYWNLWLWDKFMSLVLGRWPLIPEQKCSVSLPHGTIGAVTSDKNAPDVFCERRLQIDLSRIASELLSCTDEKPSSDPVMIDGHLKRLDVELLQKLPPAFRLNEPDTSWDKELPNLKRQREMFRISVFATKSSLLRPIILLSASRLRVMSPSNEELVAKHKSLLIDVTMEMLDSVGRLHTLMGGKQNRFFLLSFFTLEPAALLAMCLKTINTGPKAGKRGSSVRTTSRGTAFRDQDQLEVAWRKVEEAMLRLEMLSEVNSIARTGLKVLRKLVATTDDTHSRLGKNGSMHDGFNHQPQPNVYSFITPPNRANESHSHNISPYPEEALFTAFVPPLFDAMTPGSQQYQNLGQDSPQLPNLDHNDWPETGHLQNHRIDSSTFMDWDPQNPNTSTASSTNESHLAYPAGLTSLGGPLSTTDPGQNQYQNIAPSSYVDATWPFYWPGNLLGPPQDSPLSGPAFTYGADPTYERIAVEQEYDWAAVAAQRG